MNLKNLTPGQKHAIRRILTSTYGFAPISREVYTQLVKRAIVVKTDEVYERTEWGRVVARLPVARIEVPHRAEVASAIGMVRSGDTYVLA